MLPFRYIKSLDEYLISFYERAIPLARLEAELAKVNAAFEQEWAEGTYPGWEVEEESESSALFCVACM